MLSITRTFMEPILQHQSPRAWQRMARSLFFWVAHSAHGRFTPGQPLPIIAVWSLQTVCRTSFAGPPDVVVPVAIRPPPRTVRRHTRWRTESSTSVRPRPPDSLLFSGKEHAAIDPSQKKLTKLTPILHTRSLPLNRRGGYCKTDVCIIICMCT